MLVNRRQIRSRSTAPRGSALRSAGRFVVGLVVVLLWLAAAAGSAAGAGFAPGDLFVADHSQVVEYTADGAVVRTIIDPSFVQVFDLAFSPSAQVLYVTDAIAHDVKVVDGSGNVISSFGAEFLAQPRGIAVASNGDVYVADTGGDDVDVFDASGNHLRSIGPVPVPLNLAFSADGQRLFVSESNYFVGVQVFDLADADRYLGTYGETAAQVGVTSGLAVDAAGTLYVGDYFTDTVKTFNPDGSFATTLISGLTAPSDLTLASDGDIWLTNTNDFVGDQIRAYTASGAFVTSFGAELVQPTGLAFAPAIAAPPATLTLSPTTATVTVDSQHCVTAMVVDRFGNASSGVTVRFTVTGSDSTAGSGATAANGEATFCYSVAALPGSDAIHAFADTNANAVQDAGEPSDDATATIVPPPSTPGCTVANGGSLTAANGDTATFAGNASFDGVTATGDEQYIDHGPAATLNVAATTVRAVVCSADRTHASVFGNATINGGGPHAYRIDVADGGEPGRSDTYRIRLDTGYTSGEQPLSRGNVQIR
jgi:sugar lactone lactonase YvrE